MFYLPRKNSHKLTVQTAMVIALILGIVIVIFAQGEPETVPMNTTVVFLKTAGLIIGSIITTTSVVYAIWNRKTYEGQNDTIAEQRATIEAKNERIATMEEKHKGEVAQLKLKVVELETDCRDFKTSNRAIVGQNLQAKAILTNLRKNGVWDGDENDIFGRYK